MLDESRDNQSKVNVVVNAGQAEEVVDDVVFLQEIIRVNNLAEDNVFLEEVNPLVMAESRTSHIHRFNGQNFQLWKRQTEIYMAENKLKGVILGTEQRTDENAAA